VSMQIELPARLWDTTHCRGGFADVSKWEYRGRGVAVKVLRISINSDMQKITRVSHW